MLTIRSPATSTWPVQDIIYVAIVGTVMLAALLEWMLWLLAFVYCLVQAFKKAEGSSKWSIRLLATVNIIVFTCMRCIFLPIMVVTLPLPQEVLRYFPIELVTILQWFAFYAFAALLTIPWLFCVYQLVTHDIGRKQRIRHVLDENTAPKVAIIMPCYHEEPTVLIRTVDSLVDCDYPPSCLHIFLSFDGDKEDDLYLTTIDKLGVPLTLTSYPTSIDVVYRQCRITVSRFPHGGKRSCQKHTFKLVDRIYQEYLRRHDDLFVLFIDSDCILDKYCIQSFLYEMELKPGSNRDMLAQTGIITTTTTKNSLITILQDMEYVHGQLFERTVESGCGAVTCLPGALTILRFSAFRKVAKWYFADKAEHCKDIFDYGQTHLGEDRWLTHLFMISCTKRYQIQMNTGAFCKTEAVQTFKSLLKQRRRWFLGFITNEAVMLSDVRLWKRYPILMLIRLAQNTIRTTALLFFIMVISILTTSQKVANLPFGFIAVSLGLNWALMMYFAAKLGRYKVMLFRLMFVVNPFFNWLYLVYGIFTAGQRTWGGPRADAGKAVQLAAAEKGYDQSQISEDDLVKAQAAVARAASLPKDHGSSRMMPSASMEGRFTQAERMPGGWFRQSNDSGMLNYNARSRRRLQRRRGSKESRTSAESSQESSPVRPRRVESLVNVNDATTYHKRQADQPQAGGAHYEVRSMPVHQPEAQGSQESVGSYDSVSLHFYVPPRPSASITTKQRPGGEGRSQPVVASSSQPQRSKGENASDEHIGRSPLARKSFTKLAVDQKTEAEVSLNDDESRGRKRRRPSVSIDPSGRRRLSKVRHSRDSSRHD